MHSGPIGATDARTQRRPTAAVPFGNVIGGAALSGCERASQVHIFARRGQGIDCAVQSRTECRPDASVPFGYVIGGGSACTRKGTTCIEFTSRDGYRGYNRKRPIVAHTGIESLPSVPVPPGNVIGHVTARPCEPASCIQITACRRESSHSSVHLRTNGRPTAAVPFGDVTCRA